MQTNLDIITIKDKCENAFEIIIGLTNITEVLLEIKPHVIMILALRKIVVYAKIMIVSVVLSTRTIWQHVTKSFWQA